jgi:hypothetical protein
MSSPDKVQLQRKLHRRFHNSDADSLPRDYCRNDIAVALA